MVLAVALPSALATLAAFLFPGASALVAKPFPAYLPFVKALCRGIVGAGEFEHARHVHDGVNPLRRNNGVKV